MSSSYSLPPTSYPNKTYHDCFLPPNEIETVGFVSIKYGPLLAFSERNSGTDGSKDQKFCLSHQL